MAAVTIKQHERVRVPASWDGQSKDLITQLNRIFDDIYIQLGKIEQRLDALEDDGE